MKNNRIQRYEWEDLLIEAETKGILSAGAVNMCLRLARAIHWEPKANKPSGLYWKNETALQSVNSSRATYYRHRKELFEAGFFIEVAGNLIPQLPDLSQIETAESQVETTQSQIETPESQLDNPYTVDTYTDDLCSENLDTVKSSAVADAPSLFPQEIPSEYSSGLIINEVDFIAGIESELSRQSQIETADAGQSADDRSMAAFQRKLELIEW